MKLVLDLIDGFDNESSGLIYELVSCWPSVIGDVELSQGGSEMSVFPVTIVYQYYVKRAETALDITGATQATTNELTDEQIAQLGNDQTSQALTRMDEFERIA